MEPLAEELSAAVRARVLVVDDNAENRALVEETLASEALDVVSFASGDLALRSFAHTPADCVLLDVRMPGKDGFATLRELRALPGGAEVPVVFLTALRDLDTFDRALAAGAADFLTKPVRPAELIVRVQTLLRLRRLGAEVHAHHAEIRRQRDALMRLQLQKERLSAFVVHDLKSPVSAMRLHATLLLRDTSLSPNAHTSARTIHGLSDRLHQLVLNLLDLAKAEEGQLEPRRLPVPLAPLAGTVLETFAGSAEERGVSLRATVGDGITVRGDPDLLRRTVENLIDNALRHAPPRTCISIEADARDGQIELRVADEGPGVPAALRERIFDRFVQVEVDGPTSRGGRGLGLAFCRTAVELLEGSIEVDGARAGAVFVVRLPAWGPST